MTLSGGAPFEEGQLRLCGLVVQRAIHPGNLAIHDAAKVCLTRHPGPIMPQESALGSLPSFSKTAFSQTSPQIEYKAVRRIRPSGAKNDTHVEECRPTLIKQSVFPNAKDIILINGVDPNCKTSVSLIIDIGSVFDADQ